jgi:hypothetical protein
LHIVFNRLNFVTFSRAGVSHFTALQSTVGSLLNAPLCKDACVHYLFAKILVFLCSEFLSSLICNELVLSSFCLRDTLLASLFLYMQNLTLVSILHHRPPFFFYSKMALSFYNVLLTRIDFTRHDRNIYHLGRVYVCKSIMEANCASMIDIRTLVEDIS